MRFTVVTLYLQDFYLLFINSDSINIYVLDFVDLYNNVVCLE